MKYRNFDPETNQPITALELLQKLEENAEFDADIIDLTEVIMKKGQKGSQETGQKDARKDRDITTRMLDKYSKIAKSINSKSIRQRRPTSLSSSSAEDTRGGMKIAEFDEYLARRYPQASSDTKQKLSLELTKRIRELLESKE